VCVREREHEGERERGREGERGVEVSRVQTHAVDAPTTMLPVRESKRVSE